VNDATGPSDTIWSGDDPLAPYAGFGGTVGRVFAISESS